MLKFLSLFSCWLLLSGSISQAPPTAFPDVPTITASSVGKARIGMTLQQFDSLYKNCDFSSASSGEYGLGRLINENGKPDGALVSSGGQLLFAYFLDWQTKTKIATLVVLHPAYKTIEGIHVGNSWKQLKVMLPTAQSEADSREVRRYSRFIACTDRTANSPFRYFFQRKRRRPIDDASVLAHIAIIDAKTFWIDGK